MRQFTIAERLMTAVLLSLLAMAAVPRLRPEELRDLVTVSGQAA